MASSSSASPLPPEALLEIMSWADLKTLARCRLLSTEYRNLTYQSIFMKLHGRRTQTISGYFVQSRLPCNGCSFDFFSTDDDGEHEITLDFLPVPAATILASSPQNGLLLCESYDWPLDKYMLMYICKPATRQWYRVPDSNGKSFGGSFGMVVVDRSDPLWFKIVRICEKGSMFSQSCSIQVFDSRKWAWSLVACVFGGDEFPVSTAASAGGALHWLTNKNRVLSVDAVREDWEVTCLPRNLSRAHNLELVESIGKLGVMRIDRRNDSVELWVRDGRGKRWLKKETVDMGGVREVHGGGCSARGFYGSDVAVISSFNSLIFHDLRSGKDEIVTIGKQKTPETVFFLQSDFQTESLLMRSRTKKVA